MNNYTDKQIEDAMSATPTAKVSRSRRSRPRKPINPADACPLCGDYLNVRWRGRWWCANCDDTELFGDRGQV